MNHHNLNKNEEVNDYQHVEFHNNVEDENKLLFKTATGMGLTILIGV